MDEQSTFQNPSAGEFQDLIQLDGLIAALEIFKGHIQADCITNDEIDEICGTTA